jgi:putative lipoprotein
VNGLSRPWIALALGMTTACASTDAPEPNAPVPQAGSRTAIEGTATYRERLALPPTAEFEAVLQDVSRADAPAMEVARTTIPSAPMPPIRFTIPYDAGKIDPAHSYAVRAVIRVEGKLWFSSDTGHPVLTRGAGRSVEILLKRAAEPPVADAELMNTYWKILALAGEPVSVADGRREPHLVLKNVDGRDSWSARVGCNSMSGLLTITGERMTFHSGIATLMGCPPPLDVLEKKLVQALEASTQWRIEGNRLELRDDAGVQTFLCEAVHLK